MDEQKLGELFRDAAGDAPPPSFDVDAVRSASARATARRRSAVALGSAVALVLVFGGLVLSANFARNTSSDTAAAGSAEHASSPNVVTPFSAGEPEVLSKDAPADRSGGNPPESIPEDPSTQGDDPSGSAGRTLAGSAQRGCVEVDRELAVALADELSVANAEQAAPAVADCPTDARGASFLVRDGDVYGTVSAVLAREGAAAQVTAGSGTHASARTSGGEELHVLSRPAQGSSEGPLADDLAELADRLAARF
ncbi:hypothetical protein IOD16_35395 [Saccharothrix sp. 6-C]|uniref:hypothetical protein n=1 Tax=Saccharothrix sp. 6-C TaxID=2781735 RepID=UPI001917655F|nr:hypothetical protein [Saccharothrix sp. 6-C]QQQ76250.1 hypothetical protein IOD16_35395 [Saccharothrix sp. 6-C]